MNRWIRERIAYLEARIKEILAKYRVSSPEELWDKFIRKELPEHPTWEDWLELESLLEEKKELEKLLEQQEH